MSTEFTKLWSGAVRSIRGFTVRTKMGGGVDYEDASGGTYHIDSEWAGGENGIILYRPSPSNKGNSQISEDEIFADVIRALQWQGYSVDVV